MRHVLVFALGLFVFASPIWSQLTLTLNATIGAELVGTRFARSVTLIDDINHDGADDLLIVSGGTTSFGDNAPGFVRVLSGATGLLLRFHIDPSLGFAPRFSGDSAGIGDIDGDGVGDYALSALSFALGDGGLTKLYSGADGTEFAAVEGGLFVKAMGDVNGDGHLDALIGSPNLAGGVLTVRVVDLVTGAVVDNLNNLPVAGVTLSNANFAIETMPDANGDGVRDILIAGSPTTICSGADGSVLHSYPASPRARYAGDVNADGQPDIIIGIPMDSFSGLNAGRADIYSATDGSLIHMIYGDDFFDQFGMGVGRAGDVNGDGFDDLIIGSPNDDNGGIDGLTGGGRARIFSGRDASCLHDTVGELYSGYGNIVGTLGDVNDDGFDDVFALGTGLALVNPPEPGFIRFYLSPRLPTLKYASQFPFAGGDILDADWAPDNAERDAETGTINVSGATAYGLAAAVYSFEPDDRLFMGSIPLVVSLDSADIVANGGFGFDAFGQLSIAVNRIQPSIAGQSVFLQWLQVSPELRPSNGLRIDFVSQ